MKHCFKDFDVNIENKGDEIIISIKGDKEKLIVAEKKLKAMRELCCGGEGETGCC